MATKVSVRTILCWYISVENTWRQMFKSPKLAFSTLSESNYSWESPTKTLRLYSVYDLVSQYHCPAGQGAEWLSCDFRCSLRAGGPAGQIYELWGIYSVLLWLCHNSKCYTSLLQEGRCDFCVCLFLTFKFQYLR